MVQLQGSNATLIKHWIRLRLSHKLAQPNVTQCNLRVVVIWLSKRAKLYNLLRHNLSYNKNGRTGWSTANWIRPSQRGSTRPCSWYYQSTRKAGRSSCSRNICKVPGNNNKRMKLNVFNIFLERQDSITTCQKKNMRNFCSRKCQSIRSSFFNIDTFGFSKIQIKLTNNLNL